MLKNKRYHFFPECFSLVLLFLLSTNTYSAEADKENFARYESIFNKMEMEATDGKKIVLRNLKTQTVVVNFWASWCLPCLEEIPSMVKLTQKVPKEKLIIVAINTEVKDQLKNITKIEKKFSLTDSFIIVPDKKFRIADEFKFSAIPVTVIFKNGKVVFYNNGPVDFQRVPADLVGGER
jgi:thiol-disulfide isomerase/thioredoxin